MLKQLLSIFIFFLHYTSRSKYVTNIFLDYNRSSLTWYTTLSFSPNTPVWPYSTYWDHKGGSVSANLMTLMDNSSAMLSDHIRPTSRPLHTKFSLAYIYIHVPNFLHVQDITRFFCVQREFVSSNTLGTMIMKFNDHRFWWPWIPLDSAITLHLTLNNPQSPAWASVADLPFHNPY